MSRKILSTVFAVFFALAGAGCSAQEPEQKSESSGYHCVTADMQIIEYCISEEIYSDQLISIKYPKISGFQDTALEEKCNNMLEKFALSRVSEFKADTDSLEIVYEVMTATPEILSVVLYGSAFPQGSDHSDDFLYTLNVDLQKNKIVRLADYRDVSLLSQSLVSGAGYEVCGSTDTEQVKEYLGAQSEALLFTSLSAYDANDESDSPTGFSYIKDGKTHLCMKTDQKAGNYLDLKID